MLGSRRAREGILLALIAAATACGTNPRYCDETTQCGDPSQVCDLNGVCPAAEGLSNSCIDPADICWDAGGPPTPDAAIADAPENTPDAPQGTPDAALPDGFVPFDGFSCTANEFIRCDGSDIVTCSSDGMSELTNACTYGCNSNAERCNECTPSTVVCNGSTRTTCSANGLITEQFNCPLDCHPTEDRCYDLDPSNNLAIFLDQTSSAPDIVLTDGATINTDTGAVVNGDSSNVNVPNTLLAAPSGGVQVRVLMVGSAVLNHVIVNGTAALAIVSDGIVEIRGKLDVASRGINGGPGAKTEAACQGGSAVLTGTDWSGGGGAGFGAAGGRGGNVPAKSGGAGGGTVGNSTLIPLRGGCNAPGSSGPVLGGGGGAIQIASRTEIRFSLSVGPGHIAATGASGGRFQGTYNPEVGGAPSSGKGGGSGGGVLLEAPIVTAVNGTGITANGGTGGCGTDPGSNGALTTSPIAGPSCGGSKGDGGDGSALTSPAGGAGGDVTSGTLMGGGGGGGGVGRIRINTAAGTFSPAPSAIVSPAPSVGTAGRR